jgi:hypothetical protein
VIHNCTRQPAQETTPNTSELSPSLFMWRIRT